MPKKMTKYFQNFKRFKKPDALSIVICLTAGTCMFVLYIFKVPGRSLIISFLAGIAVVLRYVLGKKNKPLWPVTVMLAILAFVTYFSQVHPRLMKFIRHKRVASYHYFLGSKYFNELGYYGLYRYTLLADRELPVPRLSNLKKIRRLEDLSSISVPQAIERAKKEKQNYFSQKRWREFKRDWRRMARGSTGWERKLNDHGFNPPPFWNTVPGIIAQNVNTADKTLYMAVRLADLAVFLILLCAVAYFTGLNNALLCYIFINAAVVLYYPHGFVDTYFQFQWLNAMILSMIFYRTGRMKLAGISLAYSAMARIFPLVLVAGPGIVWIRKIIHGRKLPKSETSFLASFAASCLIFVMVGLTQGKGVESTKQFVRNITFHADAIKFDGNKFGLKRLMSVDFSNPFKRVKNEERQVNFTNNRNAYVLLWLLLVGLNAGAMYYHSDDDTWAIPLGIGLIFALMTASRYYYLMLLIFFIPDREKTSSWFATISAAVIFLVHGIFIFYRGGGYGGFTLGNMGLVVAFLIFPLSLLSYQMFIIKNRVVS